jgi:hypothetical protein
MGRWQVALVALCFIALALSIAERVRFLRLKSQPASFRLPTDREPTEEERALFHQSLSDQMRAMSLARTNSDLALLVGVGPLIGSLVWALVKRRRTSC